VLYLNYRRPSGKVAPTWHCVGETRETLARPTPITAASSLFPAVSPFLSKVSHMSEMTIREHTLNQAALLLESRGAKGTHEAIVGKVGTYLGGKGFMTMTDLQSEFGLSTSDAEEVSGMGGDQYFTAADAKAWAACEGANEWASFVAVKENSFYSTGLQKTLPSIGFCLRR
jgi:hypothetical protein